MGKNNHKKGTKNAGGQHNSSGGQKQISKKAEKRKLREDAAKRAAIELFSNYYMPQYGEDRWPGLLESLKLPVSYCALSNKWAAADAVERVLGLRSWQSVSYLPHFLTNAHVKASFLNPDFVVDDAPHSDGADAGAINGKLKAEGGAVGDDDDDKDDDVIQEASPDASPQSTPVGATDAPTDKDRASAATAATATAVDGEDHQGNDDYEETEAADDGESDEDVLNTGAGADQSESGRWPAPGISTSLDPQGLCCYYPLDAASLLPVQLLNVREADSVLDMCAAPGGKSIAILQQLGLDGQLLCSDISPDRRTRLKNTLRRYLPPPMQERVDVIAGDATAASFCSRVGYRAFDRVLVDAPCSSERHLLHSHLELQKWGPGRSKANAERQIRLLYNAVQVCKLGGRVVYSTCSLSEVENDNVIEKVLKLVHKDNSKLKSVDSTESDADGAMVYSVEPVHISARYEVPFGEPTRYGWHILPDRGTRWGPIYLCVLDVVATAP